MEKALHLRHFSQLPLEFTHTKVDRKEIYKKNMYLSLDMVPIESTKRIHGKTKGEKLCKLATVSSHSGILQLEKKELIMKWKSGWHKDMQP